MEGLENSGQAINTKPLRYKISVESQSSAYSDLLDCSSPTSIKGQTVFNLQLSRIKPPFLHLHFYH